MPVRTARCGHRDRNVGPPSRPPWQTSPRWCERFSSTREFSVFHRQTRRLYLLALLALWGVTLGLSVADAGDGVLPGDVAIARRVQTLDGPLADAVEAFGNWVGSFPIGFAIALPVAIVLGWRHRWRVVALLVAVHVIRALNTTIKGWTDSPRPTPDLVRITDTAGGFGFPSGHAMGSLLVFGALALIAWRELPPSPLRPAAVAACLAVVLAAGLARIRIGVHWPSDVLGGYLYGAAFLLTLLTLPPFAAERASGADRAMPQSDGARQ